MGLYGLGWVLRGAALGRPSDPLLTAGLPASPLLRLERALSDTEGERVARHLEANREGAAELLELLRAELPEDAILFGFHATAEETADDPAADRDRRSALALLGHLQLLLHPIHVAPMPPIGPGWTPPPGTPLERLYALDLGFPDRTLLPLLLEPGPELSAGQLWVPRGSQP